MVLKRMVLDLNVPVTIGGPPDRPAGDGLALSSRNAYLTPAERAAAPAIYKGIICRAPRSTSPGSERRRNSKLRHRCSSPLELLLAPEYIEIVDTQSPCSKLDELNGPALMAVACRTAESGTRLIDNIVLGGSL